MDDNSMVPRASLDGAQSVIEQLQAENARLRLALRKYGRHQSQCAVRVFAASCDCGLDSALNAARDLTKESE